MSCVSWKTRWCLSLIIGVKTIFAWLKCSKKYQAAFGVKKKLKYFAVFGVIFRPVANKRSMHHRLWGLFWGEVAWLCSVNFCCPLVFTLSSYGIFYLKDSACCVKNCVATFCLIGNYSIHKTTDTAILISVLTARIAVWALWGSIKLWRSFRSSNPFGSHLRLATNGS
jgi:hypothetical protein